MEQIIDSRLLDLIDCWKDTIENLNGSYDSDWGMIKEFLMDAQYSYIRFGLMLDNIKANRWYQQSGEWIATFKEFCNQELGLTLWQANNYIDAAKVSNYLACIGFTILPQNYSQAVALIPLYDKEKEELPIGDRLGELWKNITESYSLSEITTFKIKLSIDPNWAEKQPVKLPKGISQKARKAASARGMTVQEYIQDLIDGDTDAIEDSPLNPSIEFTTAEIEAIEALDRIFATHRQPVKTPTLSDCIFAAVMDMYTGIQVLRSYLS